MVHGGCQSIGCFAMTNDVVDEIWRLVTAALDQGQPAFNVQVFPFRMTEKNLGGRQGDKWSPFWADLKKGYDAFERTHLPPMVSVCEGRYVIAEAKPGDVPAAPPDARRRRTRAVSSRLMAERPEDHDQRHADHDARSATAAGRAASNRRSDSRPAPSPACCIGGRWA